MKVESTVTQSPNTRTGFKGVVPVTEHKGTVGASVRVNGRPVWCGTYGSCEEAAAARNGAINALARLGLM